MTGAVNGFGARASAIADAISPTMRKVRVKLQYQLDQAAHRCFLPWRRLSPVPTPEPISFATYLRYGVGTVVDTAHPMCTGGNALSKPTLVVLLFWSFPTW